MTQEPSPRKVSWLTKLFRKKVKLTYWLGDRVFSTEVCGFVERAPDCIQFKDYYTKNNTVVKYNQPIIYVLEQIK